jgi:hypothetical protein
MSHLSQVRLNIHEMSVFICTAGDEQVSLNPISRKKRDGGARIYATDSIVIFMLTVRSNVL